MQTEGILFDMDSVLVNVSAPYRLVAMEGRLFKNIDTDLHRLYLKNAVQNAKVHLYRPYGRIRMDIIPLGVHPSIRMLCIRVSSVYACGNSRLRLPVGRQGRQVCLNRGIFEEVMNSCWCS